MRARRGNYALLFVLTSGVLFGFLALSIDIGRLKAAQTSAENAAEAAATAALMEMRVTRSRARAAQAASRAASFVGSQGLAGGVEPSDMIVSIDFGEWNWQRARDDAGRETPAGRQAIEVEVETADGGVNTLFYPIFSKLVGGAPPANGGRVPVRSRATAAMRNRDIILAFDVSRISRFDVDDLQDALQEALTVIDDQRIPGDRISLVGYAGDSWIFDLNDPDGLIGVANNVGGVIDTLAAGEPALANALYDAELVFGTSTAVAQNVQPCFMGAPDFHRFYRFIRPTLFDDRDDPNWPATQGIQYGFIAMDPATFDARPAPLPLGSNDPNLLSMLAWMDAGGVVPASKWDNPLTQELQVDEQCNLWDASLVHWLETDERVAGDAQIGANGARSPLNCYSGSELALVGGPADSNNQTWGSTLNNNLSLPEVSCGGGVVAGFRDHYTGLVFERWRADDAFADTAGIPGGGGISDTRDFAFAWAGSNPGSAMEVAADILEARADTSRDATVVLVAGSEPRCGANVRNKVEGTVGYCPGPYVDQATEALGRLDRLDVDVYVAGNVDTSDAVGAAGDFIFSGMPLNRGYYTQVDQSSALVGVLTEILSDTRIQVVQ